MLTQLLPDQISKFWPIIKYGIEQSVPPTVGEHPDKMNRLLSAALCGKLDVWVSYKHLDNVTKFEAMVVTQITYDEASNTKSLLIYALYAYADIAEESWTEAYMALGKYALSKGCSRYIAYTSVPFIVQKAKLHGADTSFTFISLPIPKID